MRVLYVLHRSPEGIPGGSELHTLDLVTTLRGQTQSLLFYPEGGRLWVRDVESGTAESTAYPLPASRFIGGQPDAERFFAQSLDRYGVHLVHFQHFLNLPLSLGRVAAHRGVPYLVSTHDYFFWCVNYNLLRDLQFCWFERDPAVCERCLSSAGIEASADAITGHRARMSALLQSAHAIVCPSPFVGRSLRAVYTEVPPAKVRVIEMGSPVSPSNGAGSRLPGPLRAAFLGAFVPPKGSHTFAALADAFRGRGDVALFVIGVHPGHLAADLAAHPHVHWVGQYTRDSLPGILREYGIDVILLLSPWAETFSYTLSEAMLAGIPVIATDLGALRERVSRHGVGFLVEAENPVPRVTRLLQDLAAHPETLEPFRERAIDGARRLSDLAAMSGQYLQVYREITPDGARLDPDPAVPAQRGALADQQGALTDQQGALTDQRGVPRDQRTREQQIRERMIEQVRHSDETKRRAEQVGPWVDHNIRLAPDFATRGLEAGLNPKIRRVMGLINDLFGPVLDGKRILDLGCLEGGYSIEAALHGATVVGIEGRETNLKKCLLAREILGLENVEFRLGDVRQLSRENAGEFDVILCMGLLYHLDDPVPFLHALSTMCRSHLVVDTHIAYESEREHQAVIAGLRGSLSPVGAITREGKAYRGRYFQEFQPNAAPEEKARSVQSSLDNVHSFWFTKASLVAALRDAGFHAVREYHTLPDGELWSTPDFARALFVASKSRQQYRSALWD